MTVALGTFHCGSQPGRTGGVDPIDHLIYPVFLGVYPGFHITGGGTVKTGGNLLINRRIGKQIPCDLFYSKLIKRHIPIDCIDHPIPKCPAVP